MARRVLGCRHPSVFSPGVRAVNGCRTYAEVCKVNRKVIGKKISLQYWDIVPKIKEVDRIFLSTRKAGQIVCEAHPEVCFELASANGVQYCKKTRNGIDERLRILSKFELLMDDNYALTLKRYLRREVVRDDVLDAMILAVTTRESHGWLRSMPPVLERDEESLPMAIWYHDFGREL